MFNYLQRAWGDGMDNVTITDVKLAIKETQEMDDEHGAFWVGVGDNEDVVLETDKFLKVIAVFDNASTFVKQADNWNEVEALYNLLLNGDFEQLKENMRVL